ncbi:hypothetical protein A2Z33_01480 [Candidatus Gottesmanbacteria bacterium RBG_16_52_11]|uniref:DNA polymerase III subunit tau-like C-terminal domain-containing protein n=1 Tax=Candidatus Gottesmanbacteria bacterium RBG_16_52_11 TaxID=1798374 RepID=A0A1F5YP78_9BACT|nr:MAG: hypothetical protein A2Z33_01480 [Candidatus Gottesmanbacteria bacterium RBG_16_52_11]
MKDDAYNMIISRAEGSFRDAVKLLEQASMSGAPVTLEKVSETLSASRGERITALTKHVISGETAAALEVIDRAAGDGTDMKSFTADLLREARRQLLERVGEKVSGGNRETGWTPEDTGRWIRLLNQAYADLRVSPLPQLPLELAVVEFSGFRTPVTRASVVTESPQTVKPESPDQPRPKTGDDPGGLTTQRLEQHWKDVIEELKPLNHSIAGVLRSARPKNVSGGTVTIEAFYKFHQEKLSEAKTKESITGILKKLFGETVKLEIILGKK